MKRLVLFLRTVGSREGGEAGASDATDRAIAVTEDQPASAHPLEPNESVRMEAVVSDTHAQEVFSALVEPAARATREAMIDNLLKVELGRAGPEASDLYERIVVAVERELICRVYDECDRVKTRAATRLGINRNTLHKKLVQYQLEEQPV